MNVTKRDGSKEVLDPQKVHIIVEEACKGLSNVSVSEVEAKANFKFFNDMKTSELQESLVDSAHDLITEDATNYSIVSGRLKMFDIRKRAYNSFDVPSLFDIVFKNVSIGVYTDEIIKMYTKEEIDYFNSKIKHERDFDFHIAAVKEWCGKYLVQNRTKKETFYETPQIAYMLISMLLMKRYNDKKLTVDFYNAISKGIITLPTPILAGVRTNLKQFSSCVLLECGDSLNSITATYDASTKYAAQRAGLGISVASLRAAGQAVRNGEAYTTGVVSFTKAIQEVVLATSQGAIRKGSITFYHNIWHYDIESLIVLKNNKGTEETRARHSDHAFNINAYFLRKMLNDEDITLFSPEEVPHLQELFFRDNDKFIVEYEKACKNKSLTKKIVNGQVLRDLLVLERAGTSRIYLNFVDNVNKHGIVDTENAYISQSNLCLEIALPTRPLQKVNDENGKIALCTLGNISLSKFKTPDEMEYYCKMLVMALDALLAYQDYPLFAAKNCIDEDAPLGIGINDFAHWKAKNNLKYGENLDITDEWMEHFSYYVIKASNDLAKTYGSCKGRNSLYFKGITPNRNRKPQIDNLVPYTERLDWDTLCESLKEHGIRNAFLMAVPPSETNSKIQNLTNGVEPIKAGITTKQNIKVVAPNWDTLKDKYQILFKDVTNREYLDEMAVITKWIDQSISANTNYDSSKYKDSKVPVQEMFEDILWFHKHGGRTLYYHNNKKEEVKIGVVEDEAPIEIVVQNSDDDFCESCAL